MLFFSDKKGVRPDVEEFSNTACLFRLVLCDFSRPRFSEVFSRSIVSCKVTIG